MIISIDAEKTLDKIKYPFKLKGLHKLVLERNFLNLMKDIYENPQLISHLMVKDWMFFPS